MKMHAKTKKTMAAAGLLVAGTAVAIAAQPRGSSGGTFAITWDSTDSAGGGRSTGGAFAIVDTIGQHDAGPEMGGGSFALHDGFLAAPPTPPVEADLFLIH